jgi:hypothetical protein
MPNWKRLTSTSGAKLVINMDAIAYIDSGVHGATLYFMVPSTVSKLVSVSVKEKPDDILAAKPATSNPAVPANPNPESTT